LKIRKGFVSNSSTSSFVCDVCGEGCSGMDIGLSDCDMVKCVNEHTICREELLHKEELQELIDQNNELEETDDEKWDEELSYNYGIPEKFCPCCQLKSIPKDERYLFIKRIFGFTEEGIDNLIRRKFTNHKDFMEYVKK